MKTRMIKCFFIILFSCLTVYAFFENPYIPVLAAEIPDIYGEDNDLLNEQIEASGMDELLSNIPDGVRGQLSENGIDEISLQSILNINIFDFFKNLLNSIIKTAKTPIILFTILTGVMLLCGLLGAFKSGFESGSMEGVFSAASVLCVCGITSVPIINCIKDGAKTISQGSEFLLSFIPVFSGAVTASGKPVSATLYSVTLFSAVQIIAQISKNVIVPLLGIYLAFCLAGTISNQINIENIAGAVKKFVLLTIGFLMTIFIAIFVIQGLVSNSADTVVTKGTKYMAASFIPVVGGAISEALNSIQGCLTLMRSTIGAFGIIVCIFIFLPGIIVIALLKLTLGAASYVGELLGVEKVPALLKVSNETLSILMGMLVFFALLFIISVTIMLVVGLNF